MTGSASLKVKCAPYDIPSHHQYHLLELNMEERTKLFASWDISERPVCDDLALYISFKADILIER